MLAANCFAQSAALAFGKFADEVMEVFVPPRYEDSIREDNLVRKDSKREAYDGLRPVFDRAHGTITAANSSPLTDGASALLLASAAAVERHGVAPLARIVAHTTHAQHPSQFTTSPIGAIRKLMERAGWSLGDVDLFEINEAFAMVAMLAISELGLDSDRVNVNGGACAQGHPIGSTGARLLVTLTHALRQRGGKRGVAALCIGGGEATAVAIELP